MNWCIWISPATVPPRNPSLAAVASSWMPPGSLMDQLMLERETRFELATSCLEGRRSTTELLPLASFDGIVIPAPRQRLIPAELLWQSRHHHGC